MADHDLRRLNRRTFLRVAVGAGLGVTSASLLAACAPAAAPSPAAPAKPEPGTKPAATTAPAQQAPAQKQLRELQFLLDVTPYGKHALYYAPQEHGEFRKAGINMKFASAQGSADTARKIGARAADFGLADTGALIIARAEGAMIKQTFMTHYRNLMSIMSLKKYGIAKPKDLEGKTIAAVAGDAGRNLLPAFAKINNFDQNKMNIITTDFPSKLPAVLAGRAQGSYEFYTSWPTYVRGARKQNEEATVLLYAEWGLDMYNNGIVVHEDLLKNETSMVKEVLQALGEGIVWAAQNPDEANTMTLKYNPALDKETSREELQIALDFLLVDEVKKNGVGTMSKDKMQQTLDLVQDNFELKRKVALDEIWTAEFAPKGLVPRA
ncbi:MAG: ABC transporter substrate-binding protein [Chloroflexi bacterium]|nr:ABC transporter substrate-binding protein [Chloroflexota bacterium]